MLRLGARSRCKKSEFSRRWSSSESKPLARGIGIDFGTSSTLAAVASPASLETQIVRWSDGSRSQASVVHYPTQGLPIVGNDALALRRMHPSRTIMAVKRLLGRSVNDVPRGLLTSLPYAVRDGPRRTAEIDLGDMKLQPHEAAALLIGSAKQAIMAVTGERLPNAHSPVVLTVPAQWGEAQRKATLAAADAASLGGVALMSEPLAAALSLGLASADAAPMAVIDLGGGTMDVSIVKALHQASSSSPSTSTPVLSVVAHAGDALLGGEDFSASIHALLEPKWRAAGVPLDDVAVAAEAEAEAEAVKLRLSSVSSTDACLRGVALRVSRGEAEAAMWPHVERLLDLCREALQEARLRVKELNTVLLVGGQSGAPMVKRAMHRMFQRDTLQPAHPEEAVACGAAIQAAFTARKLAITSASRFTVGLGNGTDTMHPPTATTTNEALATRDVTAFALGVEALGGAFIPVIARGSPLPSVADMQFTTALDAQGFMRIRVLQGNAPKAADNKLLNSATLFPIGAARAGTPRVHVRFALDALGLLQVSASEEATGVRTEITANAPASLSADDMLRLLRESQAAKQAQKEQEASAKVRAEAEAVVKYVEESLTNLADRMPPDEVELFAQVASTRRALEAGKSAQEVDGALNDLRNQLRAALQRQRLDLA